MKPLFPARRSAERFDSLVEGARHDADTSSADLLELVGALRSMPEPQARPEFVADLRGQLMVAARAELVVPAPGSRDDVAARLTIAPRRTHRERRVGVALGAVAIIGATTSMAIASQSALPGDPLYPIKRAIENTQAGVRVSDDAKGETILDNASGRLDEVAELTSGSDPDAGLVTSTLNTFSDQATQAADLLMSDFEQNGHEESIQSLQTFTAQSMDVLGSLEQSIPASAEDALLNAAQVLFTIDAAADQVCPDCGAGITSIPPQLVASGTTAIDDAVQDLAGGELPGTVAPSTDGNQVPADSGTGGRPSTLNPPDNPVSIPPTTVDPSDTVDPNEVASGLDDLVPSAGTNTNGGGNGGGNGGKNKPKPPVDLTPVTNTVNDVVNGVVDGVNDVLNGLSGK
jgi:hypothetical protein